MNTHTRILVAGSASLALLMGCGRKEEAPAPAQAPIMQQGSAASASPASPVPDRPDPNASKPAGGDYPRPGQVNNHSSPDFKGGEAAPK